MFTEDLLSIQFTQSEINSMGKAIYDRVLSASENITTGNYHRISTKDLKYLFDLYDEIFFQHYFEKNWRDKITFHLSRRMTESGGKTTYFLRENRFRITLSTTLIFQTFEDTDRDIIINGLKCNDRLEASMRIFEHEIIHVIEYILFKKSNCTKPRFRQLSNNIFGHTGVTHSLVTHQERAMKKYDIHVGDLVNFEFERKIHHGFINRINKRATVFVKNPKGAFQDSRGNRYDKFYIPIHNLNKD